MQRANHRRSARAKRRPSAAGESDEQARGWLRRGVDEKAAAGLALRHDDAIALLVEGRPELAVPQLEQILIGCRTVFGSPGRGPR